MRRNVNFLLILLVLLVLTGAQWKPIGGGTECSTSSCALNTATTAVDEAYSATTWNANNEIATKNAIRDKIEGLAGGHSAVTLSGTGTYLTLTGQDIAVDPITESDISDLSHTADTILNLASVETITGNWVNTTNPWADNEVADALTIAAGSISTSDIVLEEQGVGDPVVDGDIEWDTTTETLKIGDDGIATYEFFPGAHTSALLTANISDVSVTQTEFAELETIGTTTISANQWAAVGGIAETLTFTELNLLDGITTLSGSNTGDQDVLADTTPQLGGQLDVNGNCLGDGTLQLLCFVETASAVNEATLTNAATGNDPKVSATGGDTNINLNLQGKGTGIPVGMRKYGIRPLIAAATNVATETTVAGDFRIPFSGTIKRVGCYVSTAGTTGTMTVDINKAGTTIMTTNKVTIDTTEKSSDTAATAPVLTTTTYTADDILTFDIDTIQTTPAKGLECWFDIELTSGG